MRAAALAFVLSLLVGLVATPVAVGEESFPETNPGDLFAFGVRGLESSYARYEGGPERFDAIQRGLDWLAVHQKPDGSWNPAELRWCNGKLEEDAEEPIDGIGKAYYDIGVTGLALSAFMGAGYTFEGRHKFSRSVHRGLTWLAGRQGELGCFGPRNRQQYIYNHAFATLAMVEAYALTGNAKVGAAAQRGLEFSALARNPYFAWRYGIKPGDNDTSATGCMSMAFYLTLRLNRAAEQAGLMAPLKIDEAVFPGIRAWIKKVTDPHWGRVGYVSRGTGAARAQDMANEFPGDKSEAPTAIAVLLRQVFPGWAEEKNKDLIRKGLALMRGLPPRWENGYIDLYYWYYGSLACVHAGGKTWKVWDAALVKTLLGAQRSDGDVCQVRGSWDAKSVWSKADGGRILSTVLALLCLETPDRIRPLNVARGDLQAAWDSKTLDPALRPRLLRAFAYYRVAGAGACIAQALEAEDPVLRVAGAATLRRPGIEVGRVAIAALGRALSDVDARVRAEAARTLGTLGPRAAPVLEALRKALKDEPLVAREAASALGRVGDVVALEELKSQLAAKDELLRVAAAGAVWLLAKDAPAVEPALWQALASKDALARAEAARHLDAMGPAAERSVEVLLKALRDEDARVRVFAAGALWQQKRALKTIVDVLGAALGQRDTQVRIRACERLRLVGPDAAPATEALAAQLLAGTAPLRSAAARAIGAIGPGASGAAAALWYASQSRNRLLRESCAQALVSLRLSSDQSVAALLPRFESKDARLVEGAVRGLAAQGAEAVPALVERLRSSEPETQRLILDALGGMGAGAERAVPAIAEVLIKVKKYRVRAAAAGALARIGPAAEPALEALGMCLDDKSITVARAAVEAIAAIAVASDAARTMLTTVLTTAGKKRTAVRIQAAEALGTLGKRAKPAIPALLKTLRDKDPDLRKVTAKALANLSPLSLPALRDTLKQFSGRGRAGAALALGMIGPPAKKAVPDLASLLEKEGFKTGDPFGSALVSIGKPAVGRLKKLLGHRNAWLRTHVAELLGEIGPDAKSALGRLKKMLKDQDPNARTAAAKAIEAIKRKPR